MEVCSMKQANSWNMSLEQSKCPCLVADVLWKQEEANCGSVDFREAVRKLM